MTAAPITAPDGVDVTQTRLWTHLKPALSDCQVHRVVEEVREQLWQVRSSEDVRQILTAIYEGLLDLGLEFDHFGVNVVSPEPGPRSVVNYRMSRSQTCPQATYGRSDYLRRIWRAGAVAYRRDLRADANDGDALLRLEDGPFGQVIRSAVDVPFSHGTLALNSAEPDAFSPRDLAVLRDMARVLSDTFRRLDDIQELETRNRQLRAEVQAREANRRALEESETKFRALVELAPDGIILMDGDRVVECNPAWAAHFGTTADQMTGIAPYDLSPPRQPDGTPSHEAGHKWMEACREGKPQSFTWRHRRLDGELFDAEVELTPSHINGRDYVLGFMRDVSERNRAQQGVLQSARLIALGEMAAGMAHELRQPLNAISVAAEGLRLRVDRGMPLDAVKVNRATDWIMGQARRMSGLIEHLRLFSRDRSEQPHEIVQLDETVGAALGVVEGQLRLRDIDVRRDLGSDLPPILGDQYRLEQVLLNLLANARDAVEDWRQLGEEKEWVAIRSRRETDAEGNPTAVVEVEDSGVGMPDEDRERIFEPFFTTKSTEKGTGLGLSIAYAIVKDHGGEITCQSVPFQGTLFRVEFPGIEVRTGMEGEGGDE